MVAIAVDGTTYYLREVDDPLGKHYVIDGITTVLNTSNPLTVEYENLNMIVHPGLLHFVEDMRGNKYINIPLREDITLVIRDIFVVDDDFIKVLVDTPLHALVCGRKGCIAVSAFEVIHA